MLGKCKEFLGSLSYLHLVSVAEGQDFRFRLSYVTTLHYIWNESPKSNGSMRTVLVYNVKHLSQVSHSVL